MTKASCKHTAKSFSPTASVSFTIFRSIAFTTPSARCTLPIAVGVSRGAKMTSQPCDARSFCISPCCAVVHSSIYCHLLGPTVEISTKLSMEYLLPALSLASAPSIPTHALNSNWNLCPTGCSLGRGLAFSQTVHLTMRALSTNSAGAACLQDCSQGLRRRMSKLAVKAPNGNARAVGV